jgi:hypothetical protein
MKNDISQTYYLSKTKAGKEVSVFAYLTFEGNAVLKINQFQQWHRLPWNSKILVKAEINWDKPEDYIEAKSYGHRLISQQKVDAFKHYWLTVRQYLDLIEDFHKHGNDFILTLDLTAK